MQTVPVPVPVPPSPTLNLTGCDKEPIHILGKVQSHGALLSINEDTYIILQASTSVKKVFGYELDELIGHSLSQILGNRQTQLLRELLASKNPLRYVNPIHFDIVVTSKQTLQPNEQLFSPYLNNMSSIDVATAQCTFDCILHRSGGVLIIEFELSVPRLNLYRDQFYKAALKTIWTIQDSSDSISVANRVACEVQRITEFDRVMIYEFKKDGHGCVIAEAINPDVNLESSFLGLHFPSSDIPAQARSLYIKNPFRLICDVEDSPSVIIPHMNPIINLPLDLSFSVLRAVSPIHIQYLKNMGVRSSASISIIIDQQLWGLIACHNYSKKNHLYYELRTSCELLGQLVAIQISKCLSIEKQKNVLKSEQSFNTIVESLVDITTWSHVLTQHRQDLLNLVDATGVAVCADGQYTLLGLTPTKVEVIKLVSYLLSNHHIDRVFSTDCIGNFYPLAKEYKTHASGIIASVISVENGDVIIFFRPEILQTVNWAGKKNEMNSPHSQLSPRTSFASWEELVDGHCSDWTDVDVEMVENLAKKVIDMKLAYHYKETHAQAVIDAEASTAIRMKQANFIDKLCHEIRNPINGIVGSLALLHDQLAHIETFLSVEDDVNATENSKQKFNEISRSIEEVKSTLVNIDECVQHQAIIADDVLNLSKLEQGKLKLDTSSLYLPTILTKSIHMYDAVIKKKQLDIALDFDLNDETMYLKGDMKRLKQIFSNLIDNSIKMTHRGRIKVSIYAVSAKNGKGQYSVALENSGDGLSPEELSTLFNPYSIVGSRPTHQYEGSGIGLSICRELAKLMGGEIVVESKYSVGSKFTFHFLAQMLTQQERDEFMFARLTSTSSHTPNSSRSGILTTGFATPSLSTIPPSPSPPTRKLSGSETPAELSYSPEVPISAPAPSPAPYHNHPTVEIIGRKNIASDSGSTVSPSLPSLTSLPVLSGRLTESQTASKRARVLIVEDNIINQKVLLNIVRKEGYLCDVADNGTEGLRKYIETRPSLIFMDVEMPVMDGLTATIQIRGIEKNMNLPPVPIICLSGNARDEFKDRAFIAGVDIYLVKPLERSQIVRLMAELISTEKRE